MDIALKKVELIEWLARLQDEKLIQRIETLRKSSIKDLYEQRMPQTKDELKEKLNQSEKDIQEGKVHSQEEVENYFKARSDEALNDLETIYDFLAEKSQSAAQRTIESLLSRSKQLESFPESGVKQEIIEPGSNEYRYLVEGNYKVIYSYQQEYQVVHIAVIFDTRYNPEELRV
jgi:plasmid stabilization system protein ParE